MAIARLSNGKVLGAYADINAAIAPTEVGRFPLSREVIEHILAMPMPLTQEGADYILTKLDPEADRMAREGGFGYRRVGCIVPPGADGMMKFSLKPGPDGARKAEDVMKQQIPHRTHANELHFTFTGTIAKGLQLDGLQATLYVTAGEWMKLHEVTANWVIYPSGQAVNAVSCYDRDPPTADMRYETTPETGVSILETMRF